MWNIILFFLKKNWKTILVILITILGVVLFYSIISKNAKLKTLNKEKSVQIEQLKTNLEIKDSLITKLASMEGINLKINVDIKATNIMGKLQVQDITPTLESVLTYSKQEMLNIQDSIKNQKLINKQKQ